MSKLRSRVRKLELRLTDIHGLVPYSEEWYAHWFKRFDQIVAGDNSDDPIPIQVFRALLERSQQSGA